MKLVASLAALLPDHFHVFGPAMAARVTKVWIDADAQGSDHVPVWFDMD